MALDFPNSPTPNQVYQNWQWDGSKWGEKTGTGTPPDPAVASIQIEKETQPLFSGLLIPYYVPFTSDPYSDANAQLLLDLMKQHHEVPVIIVLNPSTGPGTVADANYTHFIDMLHGAGGTVCGYVATTNGTRPDADVRTDIARWKTLYPAVDGIFLDEMPWETGPGGVGTSYITLYQGYNDYCHNGGLYPVIGNPGTNQQQAWFATPTSDIIVVHENTSYPTEASMEGNYIGGHADYPYTMRAALVYAQASLDTSALNTLRKNVQWVYVTSDSGANPWDSPPTYLDQLFSAFQPPASVPPNLSVDTIAVDSIKIGPSVYMTPQANGDFWLTINAHYDGTNWLRDDVSKYAYGLWMISAGSIPGEEPFGGNGGFMFMRAVPAANPINPTWYSFGGWENSAIIDQFRHIVLGGQGIEVDGSGTFPYGRFTHTLVAASSNHRTGTLTNMFIDFVGVDDNTKPSWFIGRKNDSVVIDRAPAGGTNEASLVNLFTASPTVLSLNAPLALIPGSPPNAAIYFGVGNTGNGLYGSGTLVGIMFGGQARFTVDSTAIFSTLPINLPGAPTLPAHAVTKSYADGAFLAKTGVTDGSNAAAGQIGEVIQGTGSGISMANGTTINIASMSLTAGDWDIDGSVGFSPNASTTIGGIAAAITLTPNGAGAVGQFGNAGVAATMNTGWGQHLNVGPSRLSITSTTTVYLTGTAWFGVSTMTGNGNIRARRVR